MTDVLTIEQCGVKYQIHDPGEGVIGAAIRSGEPYEPGLLYHIHRRGFKGKALDIGAHVGNHTLWFALACGLEVLAFEPIEADRLRSNLELNNINGQVRSLPVALGRRPGRADLVGKGQLKTTEHGRYAVCALDELRITDIALIKMDVEGMEPDVIRGGLETIKRERPVIYAEAWDEEAHEVVRSQLGPLGYVHANTFGATPMEEWEPTH